MRPKSTQESKRHDKAMPPPLQGRAPGCLFALIVYILLCTVLFAATRWPGALALGVPAGLILGGLVCSYLYGLGLLLLVRLRWHPRGVRCLVVTSNSPNWNIHVRDNWLSRLGNDAIVLNWSGRSSWRRDLAVRAFRHFCGTWRNYNPAVIVFRGLRQPYVFRFHEAFSEVKAARPQYLEGLEAQMFEALGLQGITGNEMKSGPR